MTVQTPTDHASTLLTVSEVTQALRCSESTVRRLIASGELAAVTIGSARAVRKPSVAVQNLLVAVERQTMKPAAVGTHGDPDMAAPLLGMRR